MLDFFEEEGDDFGAAFDFDIDFFAMGDGGEDFADGGDAGVLENGGFVEADVELAELGKGGVFDDEFLVSVFFGVGIVDADDVLVLGEVKVGFDGIGVLLPSELEGGEGVFGCVVGGSSVSDDEGGGFLSERFSRKRFKRT